MIKKNWGCGVLLLLIIIGIWFYCDRNRRSRIADQKQWEELERIRAQQVDLLYNKHNPDTSWISSLDKVEFMDRIYSIQLERLLIHEDCRPIMFKANVIDVLKNNEEEYLIRLDIYSYNFGIEFTVIARCTELHGEIIAQRPAFKFRYYPEYLVVVEVEKIEKKSSDVSENDFVIYGRLVDFEVIADSA